MIDMETVCRTKITFKIGHSFSTPAAHTMNHCHRPKQPKATLQVGLTLLVPEF